MPITSDWASLAGWLALNERIVSITMTTVVQPHSNPFVNSLAWLAVCVHPGDEGSQGDAHLSRLS